MTRTPIWSVTSVERVGVEQLVVDSPRRLGGERSHALGPAGDAEVVDAGVVKHGGDQLDEVLGRRDESRLQCGVGAHGLAHGSFGVAGHGYTLPYRHSSHAPHDDPEGADAGGEALGREGDREVQEAGDHDRSDDRHRHERGEHGAGVGLAGRTASEAMPAARAMAAAPISNQPGRDSGRSPGRIAITAHHTASGTAAARRRRVVARQVAPRGVTATTEIEDSLASKTNPAAAAHAASRAGSRTALLGQRASRPAATTAAARQPRTGCHVTPRRRYHQREAARGSSFA